MWGEMQCGSAPSVVSYPLEIESLCFEEKRGRLSSLLIYAFEVFWLLVWWFGFFSPVSAWNLFSWEQVVHG